jgi:hypothetical protein
MQIVEPVRVARKYVQKLRAKPAAVFPLLCPVREKEWIEGWDPLTVYTSSGFAERDCVFTTGDVTPETIWVMTVCDLARLRIEIVKVTPGMTVGRLNISLSDDEATGGTAAEVVYLYTALSKQGEGFVRGYSEEYFTEFMEYWERQLNALLDKEFEDGHG